MAEVATAPTAPSAPVGGTGVAPAVEPVAQINSSMSSAPPAVPQASPQNALMPSAVQPGGCSQGAYPIQHSSFVGQPGMNPSYMGQGYGQQGYGQGAMGQPGMMGQAGMMGQPGMMGPQQGQEMAPQFNFRTIIRFMMEMIAIIQGCSLIATMGHGWIVENSSNEEQPMRKMGLWIGRTAYSAVSTLLPFLTKQNKRVALEDVWAAEARTPPKPTRWWVVLGTGYFIFAFIQEYNAYRRILSRPISDVAAGYGTETQRELHAEGDAAGGNGLSNNPGKDMLDLYMMKQREMHKNKLSAGER